VGEPESKASGFNGGVAALRKVAGEAAFEHLVIPLLPAETAALVRKPPLAVAWLPARNFIDLVRAADRIFGGDESKLMEWGHQALLGDMKTVYRMFIRLLSPQFVIERGAKLWDTYVRNQGTARATVTGDRSADVRYEGLALELMSPAYWAYQRGALRGIMDATGMKNIQVETIAGAGNNNHAHFRIRWD
jgi:hypothetical protein